ncbi:hypothetical protein KAFR_0A04300 [Kazachstania africana CBS 2517]|uniref:Cation-transporting ATPase n=1 Tax=Kazachstania africana (strain ATCC 22294 / BCRC 22015 / CBS 2517 / CECT 1963 / NBRC 1671 / NRRL Y-8276) TaxID=1071382 RepID=H2ANB5_KAZAF|nr:hypothetical protein KAFR_0A04300 [Kazachstania africana CBS 2517]CCF55865.1 hypothetical protein KAFR_0A04300 [Kazachstania africana CBS 2517]
MVFEENDLYNNNNDGRYRRNPRPSFSSTRTTSTSTTLASTLVDQNTTESYAGAPVEAVPSSIVSFHHPHSLQSNNNFIPDNELQYGTSSARRSRKNSVINDMSPLLPEQYPGNNNGIRLSSSHFRFFSPEEINNAEGSATLENTDFNITWDPTPAYEQQRIYGSEVPSRRSSISFAHELSRTRSYGSQTSSARQNIQQQPSRPPSSTSSSSLSRYSIVERIPDEQIDELNDSIMSTSSRDSTSHDSQTSNSNSDDNNSNDEGYYKKSSYQMEFLKPRYHDKFYSDFTSTQTFQRFYITEEDLVIGIAGYRYSKTRLFVYNFLCVITLGLMYLLLRWMPSKRVKLIGVKCPLAKSEWVVIENAFGEFSIEPVKRQWYNRPLSTVLHLGADYNISDSNNNNHHTSEKNPNIPILISFQYRYVTFIYSPLDDLFKTNNNWIDPDWLDLSAVYRGLPSAIQEDRILAFDKNQINLKVKSTSQILFDEILHPFYIFQIFSIILWSLDEYYYYAACIFVISMLSILQSLFETKKASKNLSEISHFNCDVRVFREEFWTNVTSSDLVPGDVYEISDPSLTTFPCDSILLTGDCIVNESMLTGESVPVSKFPATEDTMFQLIDDFQNTQISSYLAKSFLFNGTKIIRTRIPQGQSACLAMVTRTGFSTTKGSLVRSMAFPKPIGFKFYRDSFKYIGVMAIIAMLGFSISCIQFIKIGLAHKTMILRALDIITIVVPPALPATLTIGTSFALNRLKKKGIFCISPTRVNVGGKIDVMCFDKTGTLTEDGLDVLGVHVCEPNNFNSYRLSALKESSNDIFTKFSLHDCNSPLDYRNKNFLMSLLTCHSLRLVDGELIGDPLDFKMFTFTGWSYDEDFQKQKFHSMYEERHQGSTFPENSDIVPTVVHPNGSDPNNKFIDNDPHNFLGVIRSFEFLSELRRMSVIVKPSGDEVYWAFTKGAPEVIMSLCNKSTLPNDYEEILHKYTHAGHRVIACSGKMLPKHSWLYSQKVTRGEIECNMEFLGFIIFENKLKKASKGTIDALQNANIRTIMCTGDNVLTAISVGKESGLIQQPRIYIPVLNDSEDEFLVWRDVNDPDSRLDSVTLQPTGIDNVNDYTLAVTGEVFRILFANETEYQTPYIYEILLKASIYARMSPDEKHELMEQLQKIGYTVGFCGDGANDCGALKAADVGISLSEAEASVAAPFTSQIFDISCVIDVIKEGRASLVTSFACFQYMSLYSAIQFISVSFLYSRGSNLGDFQFLYIDLFLIVPIAIFMSWSKPYNKLDKKRPSANLVSLKILLPLFISFLLTLLFQGIPWIIVQQQSWYIKPIVGGDDAVQSSDNTVLFFISNFQYILTAVVLSVGPPYREPMSENTGFIVDTLLSIIASLLLMFINSGSFLGKLFQLTPISKGFKLYIICWAVLNYYSQLHLPILIKPYLRKRESSKFYKRLLNQKKHVHSV